MTKSKAIKRILVLVGFTIAIPILLLGGCLLADQIPMSMARPPKGMKTMEDFQRWKGEAIIGEGTFKSADATYTVMLAPAGRYLPSGPSAYLFDEKGNFVDWSADMGDYYTVVNHFDLTSGHVKNITHENP